MPTLGNVKQGVSDQINLDNGSISVPKRDRQINRARRKYYSEAKWSFCLTPNETITITSQEGPLPADYNKKFEPASVYTYVSGVKYNFAPVAWADLESYTTDSYVFAINKDTEKIKINQTTYASIKMDYYALPADAPIDTTQDATEELAPDTTAIEFLSIAYYWLTSQRSTANFDRFMDMYKEQLTSDKKANLQTQPVRHVNLGRLNQGFNRGYRNRLIKGYVANG